jgi:hypothetical protein
VLIHKEHIDQDSEIVAEDTMAEIFGYGEDALTLRLLMKQISFIVGDEDKTSLSDCLVFYRPSFGRRGGSRSAEFGEFDAIVASRENVYLIESKWDNLGEYDKESLFLGEEKVLRHEIFSWYLLHWSKKYLNDWQCFVDENKSDFKFEGKPLVTQKDGKQNLLATNLEFILDKLKGHCNGLSSQDNIKNVLVFFYRQNISSPPSKTERNFKIVPVDYGKDLEGNFVTLL